MFVGWDGVFTTRKPLFGPAPLDDKREEVMGIPEDQRDLYTRSGLKIVYTHGRAAIDGSNLQKFKSLTNGEVVTILGESQTLNNIANFLVDCNKEDPEQPGSPYCEVFIISRSAKKEAIADALGRQETEQDRADRERTAAAYGDVADPMENTVDMLTFFGSRTTSPTGRTSSPSIRLRAERLLCVDPDLHDRPSVPEVMKRIMDERGWGFAGAFRRVGRAPSVRLTWRATPRGPRPPSTT